MWWLAGQDFEQDRAQTVDVGPLVHVLDAPGCLFGGHVGWRAHFLTSLSGVSPSFISHDDRSRVFIVAAHLTGQTPVQHDCLTVLAQHDVVWLEVAMNHASGMRIGDGVAHAQENTEQPPFSKRVFIPGLLRFVVHTDRLRQRLALHQLHGIEGTPLMIDFIHRNDSRVLKLACDLSFFDQPPHRFVRSRAWFDFLDGHFA